jgi:hypothetical protein
VSDDDRGDGGDGEDDKKGKGKKPKGASAGDDSYVRLLDTITVRQKAKESTDRERITLQKARDGRELEILESKERREADEAARRLKREAATDERERKQERRVRRLEQIALAERWSKAEDEGMMERGKKWLDKLVLEEMEDN